MSYPFVGELSTEAAGRTAATAPNADVDDAASAASRSIVVKRTGVPAYRLSPEQASPRRVGSSRGDLGLGAGALGTRRSFRRRLACRAATPTDGSRSSVGPNVPSGPGLNDASAVCAGLPWSPFTRHNDSLSRSAGPPRAREGAATYDGLPIRAGTAAANGGGSTRPSAGGVTTSSVRVARTLCGRLGEQPAPLKPVDGADREEHDGRRAAVFQDPDAECAARWVGLNPAGHTP